MWHTSHGTYVCGSYLLHILFPMCACTYVLVQNTYTVSHIRTPACTLVFHDIDFHSDSILSAKMWSVY